MIGPELAGHVSPPQHRTTISGYVIYVTVRQLTAASKARETPGTHNSRISEHTVRRRLQEAGLPCRRPYFGLVLLDDKRRRRLQWGRNYRDWAIIHWSQVLFTDESRFCLSRAVGRTRVWRRPGERYSDVAVIQRDRWDGQSVMSWGAISARFRTELIVVPGNLTGIRYRDEILDPSAVPFAVTTLCSSRITPDHTQSVLQPRFYNNTTFIHYPGFLRHVAN